MRNVNAVLFALLIAGSAAAQAPLDAIWVSNSAANQLIKIDRSSGTVVATVATPAGRPVGVTVRPTGDVWVAIQSTAQVLACDSAGNVLGTFATGGGRPTGMGTDLFGNVWCGNLSGSFVKFTPSGVATSVAIGASSQNSAGDSKGNMWLGDGSTGTIYKVDASNAVLLTVKDGSQRHRTPVVDHDDNVYSSGFGSTTLAKWSNNGTALGTWTHNVSAQQGLAVDANGDVWLANQGTSILKFDAALQTFASFTTGGSSLLAVGVDGIGNLWVSNFGSSSITEMQPDGTVLRTVPTGASPIPIGDNTGFQRAVFTDPFSDYDGDGHANNAEATAGSNVCDLTSVPTTFVITGNRLPGGQAVLTYTDHTAPLPGLPYVMACSFTTGSIPIGIKRSITLGIDALALLSLQFPNSPLFQNFAGVLDGSNQAVGTIQIPNIAQLKNLSVVCAAVTFHPFARNGVHAYSAPRGFVIQ